MAKVTKIKASDTPRKEDDKANEPTITRKKVVVNDKKTVKAKRNKIKTAEKKITDSEETEKKPFFLFAPFVYTWRYVRDSWRELRQVHWPDRKSTWKMLVAVIIYSAFFMAVIALLDLLFSWLFGLILGNN